MTPIGFQIPIYRSVNVGKGSDFIALNTHFLLDFGDFDKSFSLDNAHASMALRSLNHDFIIHEALALALTLYYWKSRSTAYALKRRNQTIKIGLVRT